MSNQDKPKEIDNASGTLKIPHHRAPNFTSNHATGVVLSGPTPDNMYHILFHADAFSLKTETGTMIGDLQEDSRGQYASFHTTIEHDDMENFREDKARISMPFASILSLRDLLNRQFPLDENKSEEKE